MANYIIPRSNGTTITVTEATTNTDTNVNLVGQNFTGYGDEIASNFLQMLENFAHGLAPEANPNVPGVVASTGQLWYDTTNDTLKVFDVTWQEMARTNLGSVESSTLRWNSTAGRYQPEELVRISEAGALSIWNGTDNVAFSHDGIDFNIAGTATADINVTGITAVNLPEITLTTALDETYGGTGQTTFATGDILYASGANTLSKLGAGANGEVLTLAAGVPSWAATAASVSVINDLTDVDTTGVVTGSLLYKTAGDWTDTPGLTWNGTNLSATQFGGIPEANLINRASPGTISGAPTLTAATTALTATLGDIRVQGGFGFVSTEATTSFAVRAKTTGNQIEFTHANTPDWVVTGLGVADFDNPVYVTSSGAESLRVIGDAGTWATADSYISFYDSDQSDHGMQVGTLAADGTGARVNARLGNLNLYASNTLAATIGSTTTTWTQNSTTALVLRNAFLTGADATTTATVGDHNGVQHNVGYNETPTVPITSSFAISGLHIGKFLSRTTTTSRTITLNNDADIPIGGTVLIHNGTSGGTLQIAPGGGQTLTWVDGSGSTPPSATRTLANNSVCTVRKVSSSQWQIWGNGLS